MCYKCGDFDHCKFKKEKKKEKKCWKVEETKHEVKCESSSSSSSSSSHVLKCKKVKKKKKHRKCCCDPWARILF